MIGGFLCLVVAGSLLVLLMCLPEPDDLIDRRQDEDDDLPPC
jgi:hypothetical protein